MSTKAQHTNRDHVRETMLTLNRCSLDRATKESAASRQSARIDRDGTVDADNAALAEYASGLAQAFSQPTQDHEEEFGCCVTPTVRRSPMREGVPLFVFRIAGLWLPSLRQNLNVKVKPSWRSLQARLRYDVESDGGRRVFQGASSTLWNVPIDSR